MPAFRASTSAASAKGMPESPTKGFTATNLESGQSGAMRDMALSACCLNERVESLKFMVMKVD